MQELLCRRCAAHHTLGIPRVINETWFALCPECGGENQLEPTVETPVVRPTFKVIGVFARQQ
jgi:hypothetical protein